MNTSSKHLDAVIIGAGQAGLAIGYFLKNSGTDFMILDQNFRIGDSWRKRWDSLSLFTPTQYNGLPGMSFPGAKDTYPGKDQMANYLENYSMKYSLPVKMNVKVDHLYSKNNHYEIESSEGKISAGRVVVATGTNPIPFIPSLASGIASDVFQIHSSSYQNPGLLPDGDVLVVGAGTSGVEIALEVSKTHRTSISGKPTFHIPDNVFKYAGKLYWWFASNILTINTPIGRKARKSIIHGGAPLIRVSPDDLDIAGISLVPRITDTSNGYPRCEDGSVHKVSSIIWATGYKPDFSWIEMNVTDESGWPATNRGISASNKDLYFMGMRFQYGLTSGLVGGVGRDAEFISRRMFQK